MMQIPKQIGKKHKAFCILIKSLKMCHFHLFIHWWETYADLLCKTNMVK